MRNRLALGFSIAAVVWGVALLVGAFTFPAYHGTSVTVPCPGCPAVQGPAETQTLVEMNGSGVLRVVSIPLVVSVLGGALLWLRRSGSTINSYVAAWVLIGLLWLFTLAAMFSIGMFVAPATLLLTASAALSRPPGRVEARPGGGA